MRASAFSALLACILIGACDGRPRSFDAEDDRDEKAAETEGRSGTLVKFDLESDVPESTESGLLMALPASRTYTGLIRSIERARDDEDAAGFFVSLGGGNLELARSEELGSLFRELRAKTKKEVVCHAHTIENSTAWFLAEACTRIWLSPAGSADTVGLASQMVFLKGALDKLHVRTDFLHTGPYKTAAETLTRSEPSEGAKENLFGVLRSMRKTWLDGATSARDGKKIRHALEHGPYSAEEAKDLGLVDAIGYESDALDDLKERARATKVVAGFGETSTGSGIDIADIVRLVAGGEPETNRPHIAVVVAEGSIAMAAGGMLSDSGITARALQKTIRKLKKTDSVKAVVLRIDSPGGSALASDLLWNELMELRKKKPLVASVGEMAASGGYYLACAANKIVAPKTSIVGSIGVVGGKIILEETLARIGVNAVTLAASPEDGADLRAAYLSPLAPWNDEIRARLDAQIESVYQLFMKRVSKGRDLPIDAIRSIAEGRIWSGTQGLERKLVDELGGLSRALSIARKLAKLDDDTPVRVEGSGESLIELLLLGEDAQESEVRSAVEKIQARRSQLLDKLAPRLRPFVGSLQPLADGEAVLATVPTAAWVQ